MINNYVYFTLQWNLNTKSCNIQGAMKILPHEGGGLTAGLLVGRGKKSQISQIRGKKGRFCENFAGIFEASFAEKRLVKNGRFRESFPSKFRWKAIGFALIWGKFSMKLDALIAYTQASYRNMKSYFTSKLVEHTEKQIKESEYWKHIYYSSCFVEYLLYPIACCLPHLRNSVDDDSFF